MHLPALDPSLITWVSSPLRVGPSQETGTAGDVDLPLVPFPVLLLQKLQGWDDHRTATEQRYRKKVPIDERDLWWALSAGVEGWLEGRERWEVADVWEDERVFSEEFRALTRERVKIFCELCPSLKEAWVGLGFHARDRV